MATDNEFDFEINFEEIDLTVKPFLETYKPEPPYDRTDSPQAFDLSKYPLQEKDWHQQMLENQKVRCKYKITSYVIGKVKIVYNGESFKAELRNPMHGAGFLYWQELYEKEIAFARAMCYAQHIIAYGNYGQVMPPTAKEYLTIKEHEILMMEEAIKMKDATIDLEIKHITNEHKKSEQQAAGESFGDTESEIETA